MWKRLVNLVMNKVQVLVSPKEWPWHHWACWTIVHLNLIKELSQLKKIDWEGFYKNLICYGRNPYQIQVDNEHDQYASPFERMVELYAKQNKQIVSFKTHILLHLVVIMAKSLMII